MHGRVQPRHPVQIVIWLAKHAFWAVLGGLPATRQLLGAEKVTDAFSSSCERYILICGFRKVTITVSIQSASRSKGTPPAGAAAPKGAQGPANAGGRPRHATLGRSAPATI